MTLTCVRVTECVCVCMCVTVCVCGRGIIYDFIPVIFPEIL
jgi:hypothetical protein